MRQVVFPLLIVSAIVAGCSEQQSPPEEPVRPVLSIVLEPQPRLQSSFAGTIQPDVSAELSFRVLGRIVARDVEVGDIVTHNQVLASLDPSTLQLQVQAARADVTSAQAQLANASASEERQRALLESNSTSQAAYDAARQALDSATANLQAAEAALSKAEEQLSYAQLTSDFDGVVTATGGEVGQIVSPGQMVVTVAKADARQAVIDIPTEQAVLLSKDDNFQVVLQSAPSISTEARVREIAPQADSATRTRRVKLEVGPGASPNFRLGSTITALRQDGGQPPILLPATAILRKDGKTSVWAVDPASSTVALKDVEIADISPALVLLRSGANAGDRIVTAGVNSLKPGQQVKLNGGI